MKRLIDAFRNLFADAARSGGALAGPSKFALEHVDWSAGLLETVPATHPVVDRYLGAACAHSGPRGTRIHDVATALAAAADRIAWHACYADRVHEPDMAAFSRKFAATCLIGAGGALPSDKVSAGLSLQAPDAYYPPHAHEAEESYWIVGGDGDWKVDSHPWFAVRPGDAIHHPPRARHAMQTNSQPLLTVWLWTSHLDSEVLIVRG